jgi:hypothetical protein
LPRSILKDTSTDAVWAANREDERWFSRPSSAALMPIAFFSELPLSGQLNLMTSESFDRTEEIFSDHGPRSVAFVSVNTQAAGGAWSMQGAMTQGDLSSWIVAGSYKSIESANHAYDLGMSYSTQRYDGGNAVAIGAIRDSARNVGSVYGYDEWTISPRLVLGYGTGYERYDYVGGPGFWSPRLSITVPAPGFRVKALASRRALVPGAEEFAPSVTGIWLPPERTFSSLAYDGRFTSEQVGHMQISLERDLASGVTVSVRGFEQRIDNQLIEIFDSVPGRAEAALGHYYVATAGDIDARGWGAAMTHEVPGYVRGRLEYTVTEAVWDTSSDMSVARAVRSMPTDRERADSRPADVNRSDHPADGDARLPEVPREHGLLERTAGRIDAIELERAVQHSRQSVASVPAVLERRLGSAGGRPQHVPRRRGRLVGLRRSLRDPRAKAHRRRPAG